MNRYTNTTAATAECAAECRRIADYLREAAPRTARYEDPRGVYIAAAWQELENAAQNADDAAERARMIARRPRASRAAKENAQAATNAAYEARQHLRAA